MAQQKDDIKNQQKELVRKNRRNGIRHFLTLTLLILGGILILSLVAGTILELSAFTKFDQYKNEIQEFTKILFTSCVGLLCLVLGFERLFDFDNIESTLEKQNETLLAQNYHLESFASTLKNLLQSIEKSSMDSKNLILKIDELISTINPTTVLKDIDFKSLIKQADEIDFLVQGWDGWMVHYSTELVDFFRRGGKFNLLVVNFQGEDAGFVRKLMERRLEKSESQVEVEITNTISNLNDIFNEVKDTLSKKKLEVFCLNEVNWYFAARFISHSPENRDALVLSLYSHHKYLLKETPAIMLYRDFAPSVFKWFDAELETLKANSTKELFQ